VVAAVFEGALGGELVGQAVGERVGEGHAQLEDIDAAVEDGAAGIQRRVEIGIACAEVGDEGSTVLRLGAGKGLGDA